jgi:hypothetical protein
MQKIILIMIFVFLTLGCGEAGEEASNDMDTLATNLDNNSSDKKEHWYNELIMDYINRSDNELIKLSRQDTTIKIEWLLDRTENSDTAKYLVFHIGHNVVDRGDINMRFAADGWVYIDTLTRKVYEYDLPNDSLIQWVK